tara:strand:- start:48 stop:1352 length:1305 start_codon:yes stop_codon:yes gene_type:complete
MSDEKKIPKTKHNFDLVNSHIAGIEENERNLLRLGRFRADKAFVRNYAVAILATGFFILLIAFAYNLYKKSYLQPVVHTIKVPDPNLSQVIEKPIIIEKIVKVPIQIESTQGAITDFTFFKYIKINKNGIDQVIVGANYASVNSPYPKKQWCYANGSRVKKYENEDNTMWLANKDGLSEPIYESISYKGSKEFGSSIEALNGKKLCKFFPDQPPIKDEQIAQNIQDIPEKNNPPLNSDKIGSGFYINSEGYLITNEHVVESCKKVWVKDEGGTNAGLIIRKDKVFDLAVIKVNKKIKQYAKFGSIRTGEDAIALGYPLGKALGSEIKVTKGNISALTGFEGDQNFLQFTAPIQPGSSGGPLLNEKGNLVGVSTANLEGVMFQNINFAVKGTIVQKFLAKNNIDFTNNENEQLMRTADIADMGKKFTTQIICTSK